MNEGWITFLNGILKMPGSKVNRAKYLTKTFKDLSPEDIDICLKESPIKAVSLERIEREANSAISSHTLKVTAISTASGIPGGLAMLATIPADLANYYYHVVAIGQKQGYLYGFPDMIDDNGNLTKDGEVMLTAFIGVMNNVKIANELIKKIAVEIGKRISEETATRIAGNVLSKQIVAQSIEVVSKKLGAQITSKGAGRAVTKAIPFISGVICGGITFATFRPQAKRLHEALKSNAGKYKCLK